MLNLLIMDKDIEHALSLLNYISKNSNNIRVYSITNNLSESIEILNTGLIDITLINLDTTIESIIMRLHSICNSYSEKYKKSFLLLSNKTNSSYSDCYVYECIFLDEDISIIFSKINEIANLKTNKFDNSLLFYKINKALDYIGYNLSYNGTKYISECIALIYNNSNYGENLNRNIYPILANKYHKSINTIKCNIASATNCMFYECNETRLKTYFNFYTPRRPTPKLVIHTILNKLDDSK